MKQTIDTATWRDEQGGLLLRLLEGQALEGFERSFKMAESGLLPHRYLLGIRTDAIAPGELFELCAKLRMPDTYLEAFREKLSAADSVHFGFEQNESGRIYKAYLEFWERLNQALAEKPGPAGAVLLYEAFKWDMLDPNKRTIASYHCHPRLPAEAVVARLAQIYAGHDSSPSADVASAIVGLAASHAGPPMYLEVSEQDNPRKSFDINLYDARMRLEEIGHLLERLRVRYAIVEDEFRPMYERIRRAKLGHISGGIGRDGGDFLTVYYESGVA